VKPAVAPILALLWLYRTLVSAPLHALYGPTVGCRFYPTCSHYAAEAVAVHGPLYGLWLSVKRLLKCTPFHPGGVDPVLPRRETGGARKLRCERVPSALNSASAPLSTQASSASSQLLFHG
jgi:putative membrane protein insertion efficiency factor